MFVEHVALQPNFRFQARADGQLATQSTAVNQYFELDAFEIEMNPKQFTTGKRID